MIMLKNNNGVVKKAPIGFSWTTFFFGFFVPLFRSDFKWALIMFFSMIIIGGATYGIGGIILGIIFSVKYNEWYLNDLKDNGYKIMN